MNQELHPDDYQKKVDAIVGSYASIEKFKKEFMEWIKTFPRAATRKNQTENCFGNHIINGKNCVNCYSVFNDISDAKNCFAC